MHLRTAVAAISALFAVASFAACGDESQTSGAIPPLCSAPAPLLGSYDARAPGYIVLFHDGVDATRETERLAALYGFEPTWVWPSIGGFAAELEPETVAQLRCVPSVASISYNAVVEPA